jgi:hypothetical protein
MGKKRKITNQGCLEIVLLIIVFIIWIVAWLPSIENPYKVGKDQQTQNYFVTNDERSIAADAINNAVNGGLTAASIILAACAAVIGLYNEKSQLSEDARKNFKAATSYGLLSIMLAVINMAIIPSHVNIYNIANEFKITLLGFAQLVFFIFSAWRLILAVRKMF